MKNILSPTITPTAHERAEWLRFADALDKVDQFDRAARLRVAASSSGFLSSIALREFDELQKQYRAWLVFGTV